MSTSFWSLFHLPNFNSIKVRLEHLNNNFCPGCLRHFNSIKVRLELPAESQRKLLIKNFNSIKVRLERSWLRWCMRPSPPFQFHKGTIRTDSTEIRQIQEHGFQFHKGTIRTDLRSDSAVVLDWNFNSIKVRLEQATLMRVAVLHPFQFHKGTIRTSWYYNTWILCITLISIP